MLDPNALLPDGSRAVSQYAPSPDAQLLAYAVADGGADWATIYVRDIATGVDLSDEIKWKRFSDVSWTKDANGFFYSSYPEPPTDKLIAEKADQWAFAGHHLRPEN